MSSGTPALLPTDSSKYQVTDGGVGEGRGGRLPGEGHSLLEADSLGSDFITFASGAALGKELNALMSLCPSVSSSDRQRSADVKNMDSGVRLAVRIPSWPLVSYTVLGKLFNIPVPQFPHLCNGDNNDPSLLRLLRFQWNHVHKNTQHGFPSV